MIYGRKDDTESAISAPGGLAHLDFLTIMPYNVLHVGNVATILHSIIE